MVCIIDNDIEKERTRNEIRQMIEVRLTHRKEVLLVGEDPPIPNVKRSKRELSASPVYKRTKSMIPKRMDKIVAAKKAKEAAKNDSPADIRFYSKTQTDKRDSTISILTKQLIETRKLLDEFQKNNKFRQKKPRVQRRIDLKNDRETKYKIESFLNYSETIESLSGDDDDGNGCLRIVPRIYDVTSSYDQEERELDSMEAICNDAEMYEKDIAADPQEESDPFTDSDFSDVAKTLHEELHDAGGYVSDQGQESDRFSMCSERITQLEASNMLSESERMLSSILGSFGDSFSENERLVREQYDLASETENDNLISETSSLEELLFGDTELPLLKPSSETNTESSLSISDVMVPTRDFTSERPSLNFSHHKRSDKSTPSISQSFKGENYKDIGLDEYENGLNEIEDLLSKYDEYRKHDLEQKSEKLVESAVSNGRSDHIRSPSMESKPINLSPDLIKENNGTEVCDHKFVKKLQRLSQQSFSDKCNIPIVDYSSVKSSSGATVTTLESNDANITASLEEIVVSSKSTNSNMQTSKATANVRSRLPCYSQMPRPQHKPKENPPSYGRAVQEIASVKTDSTIAINNKNKTTNQKGTFHVVPNKSVDYVHNSIKLPENTESLEVNDRMKPDHRCIISKKKSSSLSSYHNAGIEKTPVNKLNWSPKGVSSISARKDTLNDMSSNRSNRNSLTGVVLTDPTKDSNDMSSNRSNRNSLTGVVLTDPTKDSRERRKARIDTQSTPSASSSKGLSLLKSTTPVPKFKTKISTESSPSSKTSAKNSSSSSKEVQGNSRIPKPSPPRTKLVSPEKSPPKPKSSPTKTACGTKPPVKAPSRTAFGTAKPPISPIRPRKSCSPPLIDSAQIKPKKLGGLSRSPSKSSSGPMVPDKPAAKSKSDLRGSVSPKVSSSRLKDTSVMKPDRSQILSNVGRGVVPTPRRTGTIKNKVVTFKEANMQPEDIPVKLIREKDVPLKSPKLDKVNSNVSGSMLKKPLSMQKETRIHDSKKRTKLPVSTSNSAAKNSGSYQQSFDFGGRSK